MAHIVGTSGNDNLTGAGEDDLIEGFGGNDFLGGADGDDTLLGGDGDDILSGGVGSDLSNAGAGNDVIVIDADGSDTALGGAGDDFIIATQSPGAGGTCRIDGGKGADEIVVSEQALVTDFIIAGGDDNDYVQIQQARAARIDLGTGNDWLYIQGGQNGVTLGGGHDLLQFSSALGGIRVKDFAATGASSDSLSLGNILAHATDWDQVSNPFSSGFVRVRQKRGRHQRPGRLRRAVGAGRLVHHRQARERHGEPADGGQPRRLRTNRRRDRQLQLRRDQQGRLPARRWRKRHHVRRRGR